MLTSKQEKFTQNLFSGMTQRDSWIQAGYSSNYSMALVDTHACNLAKKDKIKIRLKELRDLAASNKIASVSERKQRLTDILRANLVDFIDSAGQPELSPDKPHHQAASEYSVSIRTDSTGESSVRKTLKLRDPVSAIQELNKMECVYDDGGRKVEDNRQYNIIVTGEDARARLDQLMAGRRELPESKPLRIPQDKTEPDGEV